MGDISTDDNGYEELEPSQENLFEDEIFEAPEESEIPRFEVSPIDLVSKETILDRLRYHFTSSLSKVIQDWMKAFDLRGLDYYLFLALMLKFFLAWGTQCPGSKLKKKADRLRMIFTNKSESTDSSTVTSEKEIEDVFREYFEQLKTTHPQLIENLDHKEEDKQRKKVPPKVFQKLGIDRDIFNKEFRVLDEDDLMKLYESICNEKKNEAQVEATEDDYDDVLRRRGRFPFISTFPTPGEEGEDINLAKWEQLYWRRMEEMEQRARDKEVKLCRLMLVRSGTSWKQELGYIEGWRDTAELGKKGRRAMEKVAFKIIKRNYKFDYVLTSTLCRSLKTADLMLVASGQEMMNRHVARALNPRHHGPLVDETLLGSASHWGWLPQKSFPFLISPLTLAREKFAENMAMMEPDIPDTLAEAENIFMVQKRVERVWNLIESLFKDKGNGVILALLSKRTILACAHRDSIEALLFHFYGVSPTDFVVCHPSYTTPIILNFHKWGKNLLPGFIDFLCISDEDNKHSENLSICWFERFISQGILDFKLLMEIIKKLEPEDIEELCNESFTGILKDLESKVDRIGRKLSKMDCYIEQGCGVTSDRTVRTGKDPLLDNYTLEEQMLWIVEREFMPLRLKIQKLKYLWETMPDNTNPETVKLLKKIIGDYEMILEEENLKPEMSMEDYPVLLEDIMEENTDEAKLEEENKSDEAERESMQS